MVLASSLAHAIWNLLLKRGENKEVFVYLAQLTICLLFAPVAIYLLLEFQLTLIGSLFTLGTGIIHVFYFIFLSRGYTYGDLSEVYPVARGTGPAIVPILGHFVLGETMSLQAYLGVLTVVTGVVTVYWSKEFLRMVTRPLSSFKRPDIKYAIATGVTIAIYSVWDKIGVEHVPGFLYMCLMSITTSLFFSLYIKKIGGFGLLISEWRVNWRGIMISAVFLYVAYGLVLTALEISKLSYVWTIRETSILIVVALSYFIEKEQIRTTTLVGSSLIVAGVATISISP
jgi:drug/metabolite transporter (DMT)-like permease